MTVSIPGKAIDGSTTGNDLSAPTQRLLRDLNLLPDAGDLAEANDPANALKATPDSVVVIESGATRAARWWTYIVGAAGAGWTAAVGGFWTYLGQSNPWNQPIAIFALGLGFAAAVTGIASLLGSDIRGRAAATVATVEARQQVAVAMIQAAQNSFQEDAVVGATMPTALPGVVPVNNGEMLGRDENDWNALAVREVDGHIEYLLTKGRQTSWVAAEHVEFL